MTGSLCASTTRFVEAASPSSEMVGLWTTLHHALLSYVFGTWIVAITVSSVAALLGR